MAHGRVAQEYGLTIIPALREMSGSWLDSKEEVEKESKGRGFVVKVTVKIGLFGNPQEELFLFFDESQAREFEQLAKNQFGGGAKSSSIEAEMVTTEKFLKPQE